MATEGDIIFHVNAQKGPTRIITREKAGKAKHEVAADFWRCFFPRLVFLADSFAFFIRTNHAHPATPPPRAGVVRFVSIVIKWNWLLMLPLRYLKNNCFACFS